MSDALLALRRELAQISDLSVAARVLEWDQLVMMPRGGAETRGDHLATVSRLAHELFVRDEIGELLERAAPGCRRPRPRLGRRLPRGRGDARLGEGAPHPRRAPRRDDEALLRGDRGLGDRAGGRRLRCLPAVARPHPRAEARVRGVLPTDGRPVRPAARRLRGGDADERGTARLRPAPPGAPRARRAEPAGGPRALPHGPVPDRDAARAVAGRGTGVRRRRAVVPARPDRPSVLHLVRDAGRSPHDALRRERPARLLDLLDDARGRPRPLRARRRPGRSTAARSRPDARPRCTSPRADSGRT